jgi:hypothetical protein
MLSLRLVDFDPKAKPADVRWRVGYWGHERNCYKWDQSVAVGPISDMSWLEIPRRSSPLPY